MHRIVVKVGSSSIASVSDGVSMAAVATLVDALAARYQGGFQVVLVTSGAVAAGLAPLGLSKRPQDFPTQQAAASVGQGLLMASYAEAFQRHGLKVGQVLLTAEQLMCRSQHRNAFSTLERLLHLGVIPLVNENDVVSTQEIRFGDNDHLAALVARLVHADALVLLSDVHAVFDRPPTQGGKRIEHVREVSDLRNIVIGRPGAAGVGLGGMQSKISAASWAADSGIPSLITSAANAKDALAGEDVGTWFSVTGRRKSIKKLWLAHLAQPQGRLVIDDGAVQAIRNQHTSLLPSGVTALEGNFEAGDAVEVLSTTGTLIARGAVNFSSKELPLMLGRSTSKLRELLGSGFDREIIHVDNLVAL
ncbi:glutamate 5-kinase [Arthrobacter sp. yr096]|nr:glutamate 5-kinase [Arthrobacter sp. yr096]SEJ78067.1 glutamate 5-kinase [Arthrobacter sp. yr096]